LRSIYARDIHDKYLEQYILTDTHTRRVRILYAGEIHDKNIDNSSTTYTQTPTYVG
jgi:hypothetical protein